MNEAATGGPSAGSLLRQAREAAGLHVAALAVSLKVPVRKLEALEADRYDLLPDAVFARALASSVCRSLKVDPQPILERLPAGPAPRLMQDSERINVPFRAPGDAVAAGWRDHLKRPVSVAVAALLLGALVIVLLPGGWLRQDVATVPVKPEAVGAPMAAPVVLEPATPASAEAPAAAPGPSLVVTPTLPVAPSGMPATSGSSPAPAAQPVAPAATAALPVAAPVATATAPASAADPLLFRATGSSWIQVTDARGDVTLRRLLNAGESVTAGGVLPLTVTVGDVTATRVEVRGKPMQLTPNARDNVARFQVN